ncbi:aspartate dehydrogenase [Candidatus Bathyarchaeota archaeon]|nr:aspartate dehydrogenase [Candidatus Bathyarchaeota archaeon]
MHKPNSISIGIIGCGAIGETLARALDEGLVGNAVLTILFDRNIAKAKALAESLEKRPFVASSFEEFLGHEALDLVVEAASQQAVRDYGIRILEVGKDLMIMSVGALVDQGLFQALKVAAEGKGRKIYIPSGAIGGLDALKAAVLRRIDEVTLTVRKPPAALRDASHSIKSLGFELESIKTPTIVFEGPASEACRLFPSNVNVAAALSLASLGTERTKVRVMVDPSIKENVHKIFVKGEFGEFLFEAHNVPSPKKASTSYLAALSAIATLKKITETIIIG